MTPFSLFSNMINRDARSPHQVTAVPKFGDSHSGQYYSYLGFSLFPVYAFPNNFACRISEDGRSYAAVTTHTQTSGMHIHDRTKSLHLCVDQITQDMGLCSLFCFSTIPPFLPPFVLGGFVQARFPLPLGGKRERNLQGLPISHRKTHISQRGFSW